MSIFINLFHILLVAPMLYLLGQKKIDWILPYLCYLAGGIVVTHSFIAYKKYVKGKEMHKEEESRVKMEMKDETHK